MTRSLLVNQVYYTYMIKPHCSKFIKITAIVTDVPMFRILRYVGSFLFVVCVFFSFLHINMLWSPLQSISLQTVFNNYQKQCFQRGLLATSPQLFKKTEQNEPRHDKTNEVTVRPATTQYILGILPV